MMMLDSIKFKDKNKDMILAYISIINDILLELILKSDKFKPGSFHFGSMIARGGKSIIKIFTYLVKNLFQQIDLFRIQCSNKQAKSFFKADLNKPQDLNMRIRINAVEKVIESCIFGLGLGGFEDGNEGGFRLHSSSKSEERLRLAKTPQEEENYIIEPRMVEERKFQEHMVNVKLENHSISIEMEDPSRIAIPKPHKSHENLNSNYFILNFVVQFSKNNEGEQDADRTVRYDTFQINCKDQKTSLNLNRFVSNLLNKEGELK